MKQLAGIKNDAQIPIYEQSIEVPEHQSIQRGQSRVVTVKDVGAYIKRKVEQK